MKTNTARAFTPLAVFFLLGACRSAPSPAVVGKSPSASSLAPSPHLIVGRVLAVDILRHFALIDIASSAPSSALAPDRELLTRTDDLRVTARLRATRQLRGHTLGTLITAGAPNLGDEVVFSTSP
ncbi:MAG: hypothetical protein H7343_14700 [Undibacterium sp.]|nr:hypothetical protein [Opitutaceae bacterium]